MHQPIQITHSISKQRVLDRLHESEALPAFGNGDFEILFSNLSCNGIDESKVSKIVKWPHRRPIYISEKRATDYSDTEESLTSHRLFYREDEQLGSRSRDPSRPLTRCAASAGGRSPTEVGAYAAAAAVEEDEEATNKGAAAAYGERLQLRRGTLRLGGAARWIDTAAAAAAARRTALEYCSLLWGAASDIQALL
ncbi:hypothetical protein ABZP36_033176 [Zizania latifolia]